MTRNVVQSHESTDAAVIRLSPKARVLSCNCDGIAFREVTQKKQPRLDRPILPFSPCHHGHCVGTTFEAELMLPPGVNLPTPGLPQNRDDIE